MQASEEKQKFILFMISFQFFNQIEVETTFIYSYLFTRALLYVLYAHATLYILINGMLEHAIDGLY